MAIQVRRGDYADFDKQKMLAGEPAAVLANDPETPSGKAFYVAFAAGDVRRLVSIEDIEIMVQDGKFKGEKGDTGTGVTRVDIDKNGHLQVTLSDGSTVDAGLIDDALALIDEAVQSAENAAQSETAAQKAKTDAQAAQKAIENLGVSASTLEAGKNATVEKSVADSGVTLYFGIPQGAQGAVGPRGEQGIAGPEGPQGPPGESGVTTPLAGWFTLSVDDDGNLWAYYADTETEPPLDYDDETGELYYIVPDELD